jgi:outer membrane protein assembly factor BamB
MLWKCLPAAVSVLMALTGVARAGDWPGFRGPGGMAQSTEDRLPTEWGKDKNILWQAAVPGVAWSSPVVVGDKVLVTSAVTDKQTKPRPGMGGMGGGFGPRGPGGGRPGGPGTPGGPGGRFGQSKPPDAIYRWEVTCLDRTTGKVLWKQVAAEHKPSIPTHATNSYASETPVTDGERVYAYFGMTGIYCYDLAGQAIWKKDMEGFRMMMSWGTGASPALGDGRLFIQCDNEEKSFLLALEAKTGKELWRVSREEKSSWSTPFLWRTRDRTEVVACGGKRVRSYDPATGKQLWELGGMNGSPNATPVASEELIYFGCSSAFSAGPLFAVKAGASGDITLKDGATSNDGVAWCRSGAGPGIASPLLYDGYIYIADQRGGMISCYDAKTGEPAYKRERLPQARGFTSSPWAYQGKVFCLDEDGKTFVIEAGPKVKVLGTNKLDDMFWSSPAISGGVLLLRGVDKLYCVKQ